MNKEEIADSVRSAIGSELCLSLEEEKSIALEKSINDLGIDSLMLINITQELEDVFAIRFPRSLGKIKTVGDLVDHIYETNTAT